MMKCKFFVTAIGLFSFVGFANATSVNHGTIKFNGSVINGTCTISTPTQTISMAAADTSVFTDTDFHSPTDFTITVNCPPSSFPEGEETTTPKIGISFASSKTDPNNHDLLPNTGTAKSLGLALLDNNQGQNKKIDISKDIYYQNQGQNINFRYAVAYEALMPQKNKTSEITAGSVSGVADFDLVYQ